MVRGGPGPPQQVTAAHVRAYLVRCAAAVERHRDYLTRLDAVLGDGDHGDNMAIGFQAVRDLLDTYPPETSPGELLRAVGYRLATAVGGASGPLYGTALMEAGLVAGSEPALDWPLIGRMLDAAANGLARRGRCVVGDKTILDTLRPAADAALAGAPLGQILLCAWRGLRSFGCAGAPPARYGYASRARRCSAQPPRPTAPHTLPRMALPSRWRKCATRPWRRVPSCCRWAKSRPRVSWRSGQPTARASIPTGCAWSSCRATSWPSRFEALSCARRSIANGRSSPRSWTARPTL